MFRKTLVLAAVMSAVAVGFAGLSIAADEPSLEKIMEKVQANNLILTKATRTKVAFAKDQKKIATAATDLAKLGKDSREFKGPAEKQKKSQAEWTKLVDDLVKKSEELADVAGKPSLTFEQAKKSYTAVKATCTNCHNVFRVDEEK